MFPWLQLTLGVIFVSALQQTNCSAAKLDTNKVLSPDGYIAWYKGTGRVIITAPHGGRIEPESMSKRLAAGCVKPNGKCDWNKSCKPKNPIKCRSVVIPDKNSMEMAFKIYETLKTKGLSPHFIVNYLHRGRLDPNREVNEATQGDKIALNAYEKFHNFTASAKATIDGPGLLVEIHGHGHFENWQEIGYRIGKKKLRSKKYSALNSTIRALAIRRRKDNLGDLISGKHSFGAFMQRGMPSFDFVPSPKFKAPFKKSKYFEGGFDLELYGSKNGGCIDAIQVEASKYVRHDSISKVNNFAVSMANVIEDFMRKNRYYESKEKERCPS